MNKELHNCDNALSVIIGINSKKYYKNGKLHRDNDLPAKVADGYKMWFVDGKCHRLGGLHAVEYRDGSRFWYIYHKRYTYGQVYNYYKILKGFGRHCLRKIRMRRLRRLRWIHGELLCMPAKGSYSGGQDYHKMVSYFMSM
jgi:hypothetical protein